MIALERQLHADRSDLPRRNSVSYCLTDVSFVVTDVFVVKYERDCEVDERLAVPAGDGDRCLEWRVARDHES